MKPALHVALAFALGCSPRPNPPPPCDADCLEQKRRFGNSDILVWNPAIWRFYDQLASRSRVPEQCGVRSVSGSNIEPLWRRSIAVVAPLEQNATRARNAISVAGGRVGVMLGGLFWTFDAANGTPLHALRAATWFGAERREDTVLGLEPFVALTADASRAWVLDQGLPALVETTQPLVSFSWYWQIQALLAEPISVDVWTVPMPLVAADGTLIWKSANGHVRAVEPSGYVRWDKFVDAGGRGFMESNGRAFFLGSAPQALDPMTGEIVWAAEPPGGRTLAFDVEVERSYQRSLVMALWAPVPGNTDYLLAAHRASDGTVAWTRSARLVSPLTLATGQSPDGTVYTAENDPVTEVGHVLGLTSWSGVPRFDLELPRNDTADGGLSSSKVVIGPIAAQNKLGVYVVSENCRLYDIDESGNVRASFSLEGRPLGFVPQLAEGILYLLAEADLPPGPDSLDWCPEDLSADPRVDYECLDQEWCRPCAGGHLYFLYAFKVEP